MSVSRTIEDLFYYLVDLLKSIFFKTIDFLLRIFSFLWTWFLDLNWPDKAIVLTGIPAMLTIILPSAKFMFLKSWYYINNPYSVYLIGVVFLMAVTLFFYSYFQKVFNFIIIGVFFLYIILNMLTSGFASTIPFLFVLILLLIINVLFVEYFVLLLRLLVNIVFFGGVVIIWLNNEITMAAPHIITWSFYLSFVVPLLYIFFSGLSFILSEKN